MKKPVQIDTPFITLGQLLKEEAIISSGGQAKWFLQEVDVLVNDEPDDRRGRKLYPGDTIDIADNGSFFIRSNQTETTD
ncbi:S4 domain-containing protein YaaA [Lactobacillus sp. CBA3605]|uniref:S4 domain-containing protein YaaA n=1 Tax=Lactobacillus sp. CBA3605 TaxID=2099788 RepID=UPI000CFC1D98|nr:S4 domain-containing protein YaaA [Lactobacillus sp. CBA3605]AVK61515.1 S4 domain-containing protein YaaA [Lactobacillus sp. CBA3605]